jgi:hypothetical protein
MNYVFLAYRDASLWNDMPALERDALQEACLAAEQDLRESGRLLAADDLPERHAAVTVRLENGIPSLAGGPAPDARMSLTRLLFIKARDLNEAIQVASRMPHVRGGPIEVRPLPACLPDSPWKC